MLRVVCFDIAFMSRCLGSDFLVFYIIVTSFQGMSIASLIMSVLVESF